MRLSLILLPVSLLAQGYRPELMRAHVEFLASDALEGRNTPSRGLDAAAEYIKAQFTRIGLKPMGDDGYFQTQVWTLAVANADGFRLTIREGERTLNIGRDFVDVDPWTAVRLADREAKQVSWEAAIKLKAELAGGVWIVRMPATVSPPAYRGFLQDVGEHKPALVLLAGGPNVRRRPRDPAVPVVRIREAGPLPEFAAPRVTATLSEARRETVKVRNVAGLWEGRDAKLKDTCVMVTAHYDHLGLVTSPDAADRVYNGANDNASGVAGVIEIAAEMARHRRPRRSVLFVAFFGEEQGMLGSNYYREHPLVPLRKTVAMLNFEQLGRTDSPEGAWVKQVNMTGFDFSDLKLRLQRAAAKTGVRLVKHEKFSDPFFLASDNAPLARAGVVAHTLSVTYQFPDYHAVGDETGKIDYTNMAAVVRMLGAGTGIVANDKAAPRWDAANAKAEVYRKAATAP